MHHTRWIITLVTVVATTGCVTASEGPYFRTPTNRDLLTRAELSATPGATENAYSAVEQLRPLFLKPRPGIGMPHGVRSRVVVFINDNLAGDSEVLKMIPIGSIESIQSVSASLPFVQHGDIRPGDGVLLVRVQ